MRLPVLLSVVSVFVLAGCGNSIVYQTRYIPTTAELTWDKEYKQLPWRPPAKGAVHYKRTSRPAKPGWPYESHFDIEKPKGEYRYAFDGKGGPITPEMEIERKQWLKDTRGLEIREEE